MTLDRDPSDVFYDKWKDAEAALESLHREIAEEYVLRAAFIEQRLRAEAAEAEVARLRADITKASDCLDPIYAGPTATGSCLQQAKNILRAALAKEDTDD